MRNIAVPRSPSALTAIAAVLALSAIPAAGVAAAQDVQPQAAPSLSLPQDVTATPATPPASAPVVTTPPAVTTPTVPTVTLPPEATAPANAPTDTTTTAGTAPTGTAPTGTGAPSPTVQQTVTLPDAAPPAAADEGTDQSAPARDATRAARNTRVQPAPVRPVVPTAQNNGTAADGVLAQGAVPPAAPAPARAVPAAPSAPQAAAAAPANAATDEGFPVAEVAGILAALGVAGLGIAAMRRRRSDPVHDGVDYQPTPIEPVAAPAPMAETPVLELDRPAAPAVAAAAAPVVAEPALVRRETVVAGNSATAILASSPLPQTAEERYELLDAMAAAAPDEGNPFTSRKGRLRRARLQLQHREHEEANGRTAGFDFRTYRPTSKPAGTSTPATARQLTEA